MIEIPKQSEQDDGPPCATYTVDDAAKILGLSRWAAYQAAHEGQIPTVRIGRRLLVPRIALERMLAGGQS
jgi:excisionase family DNA binding protein